LHRAPGALPTTAPSGPGGLRAKLLPALRHAAGRGFLIPLLVLFWVIFYQDLPNQMKGVSLKPIDTGSDVDRIIKIGMLAFASAMLASRSSEFRAVLTKINPGLVAMLVLIPLSAIWSIDQSATLLRYTTLVAQTLLCLAIPLAGWERDRLQQASLPPMMTILVASLAVGAVSPDLVKSDIDDISLKDAWHGITYQKNQFGGLASIATLFCLHRILAPGKWSPWAMIGICISVTCLALSRSSTSLLATVVVGAFMFGMLKIDFIKRRFSTPFVVSIFALLIVYTLATQNLIPGVEKLMAPIMHLTGKDMTFSARSFIWNVIKEHSAGAPWLGTGYAAYWTGETPTSASYIFVYLMHFYPTSSHNGYLEILNDLGRVGLICLLVFLVVYLRQALRLLPYDRKQAVLYLAILLQQMIANMSESEWFSRSAFSTVVTLATVCLARAHVDLEMRMRQQAQVRRAAVAAAR
jgi:O-antigen ligase